MKKIFVFLLSLGILSSQTAPGPTAIAYAMIVQPSSNSLSNLNPKPIFGPVVFIWVSVANAIPGIAYTYSIVGSTKNGGSYGGPGTSSINPSNPWDMKTYYLQIGDTWVSPPTVSLYIPAGVITATPVVN